MAQTVLLTLATLAWLVWVGGLLVLRRQPELHIGSLRDFQFPVAAAVVVLLWLLSDRAGGLHAFLTVYLRAGVVVLAWMLLVWLLSLKLRDASIMDVAYPLTAFWPVLWLVAERGTWSPHEFVTVLFAGLWSIRLSAHIGLRNHGHGEDKRYAAWRKRHGARWWWWSLFQVFIMQGVLVWLWSLGLILAVAAGPAALGWQHLLALAFFALGFGFQAISDRQLEAFKRERKERGTVLDTGLWALSRHPNYFGEAMVWWSFGMLGLVHPWGVVALVCPAYVTWFMHSGSATPMQERYLAKTKPAYADYMKRVPMFFPWGKP